MTHSVCIDGSYVTPYFYGGCQVPVRTATTIATQRQLPRDVHLSVHYTMNSTVKAVGDPVVGVGTRRGLSSQLDAHVLGQLRLSHFSLMVNPFSRFELSSTPSLSVHH